MAPASDESLTGDASTEETETQHRLWEAEEMLRAIRHGEVDALMVSGTSGEQVFSLSSADRPYRIFVENMQDGAATLSEAGIVLFANDRLGELLGRPATSLVAHDMAEFVEAADRPGLLAALGSPGLRSTLELDLLRTGAPAVTALAALSRLEIEGERLHCLTLTDVTAERRLLREISASQQRFVALYMGAPVPAFTWQDTPAGPVLIDVNEAASQLVGGAAATALQTPASAFYQNAPAVLAGLTKSLAEQVVVELETVSQDYRSDHEQHLCITLVPVPPDLVVAHTQDVTKSWLAERELRVSEERYRTIVENAQEGIGILDADGHFTFANRRTAELLGYDVGTLIGMDAAALLVAVKAGAQPDTGMSDVAQYETATIRPDGSHLTLLVSTAPIVQSGTLNVGSLCMLSDVSGLRRAEEELAHRALHDGVTGLPNRTLLTDRIDQALTRSRQRLGTVAVLFCDLDDFKTVNDSFGHHTGDEALAVVASRLRAAVRPADTVARIGGDEFIVLCEDLADESAAFGLADAALRSLNEPMAIHGHELSVTMSVGVAFAQSADPAELLRNADAAMHLAKQRGRNRAELFNEQYRQVTIDRVQLIADLRQSVPRGELQVHYQPVLTLDGESLLGVEALVRWQHPQRGLIFPDQFIPAAESANLIGEIGAWVLQKSCRQAALWTHAGVAGAPLHMAVNVSAQQLAQGSGLVQVVTDAVRDAGIDPHTLVLEVTESAVMDDAEETLATLTELKELGVQLAIDDFGTGYSSLVYLKRFPVDLLKVDRTFVSGLGTDSDDSAIVASVVGLAHAVGLVAVAEGVETPQQLAALQRLGCAFGQGYLWSRPCSAADLDRIIDSGPSSLRTADSHDTPPSAWAQEVHRYVELALAPDPDRLLALASDVIGRVGAVTAYDMLIQPALTDVDLRRRQGGLGAAEDYLINTMTEQTLTTLGRPPVRHSDPLAVVVGSARDGHHANAMLLMDALALAGWAGLSLGPLPWPLLAEFCQAHQPGLVAVSVSTEQELPEVLAELGRLRDSLPERTVLMLSGGSALHRLVPDEPVPGQIIACPTMADAVRVARASHDGAAALV